MVVAVDFVPEPAHVDIDDIGLQVEVTIPDVLQHHRAGDHLPLVFHQVLQELEFSRLEVDGLTFARNPVRAQIQLQVGHAQDSPRPACDWTAQQSLDTGEKFRKGERLHKIIVATAAQPVDPILDISHRTQEQDRRLLTRASQCLDHGQAVKTRKHAVDDRKVIRLADGLKQPIAAVLSNIDEEAGLAQALAI